ncbi:MAG: ribosome silencing factor [Ignavibacteria bacterium]|nr:ribosome silencing factor [Ignavibacteria bacterium]
MRSSTLAKKVAALVQSKKGSDIIIMNLKKLTAVTDYFVVCSADSDIQVKAIARAVEDGIREEGMNPWHREAGSVNWILLDYVDVVLHVFHRETREFYSLERLWGDAVITKVEDKGTKKGTKKPVARKKAAGKKKPR